MRSYPKHNTFADRDTIIFKDSCVTSLNKSVSWVASLTVVFGAHMQIWDRTGFYVRSREVQMTISIK